MGAKERGGIPATWFPRLTLSPASLTWGSRYGQPRRKRLCYGSDSCAVEAPGSGPPDVLNYWSALACIRSWLSRSVYPEFYPHNSMVWRQQKLPDLCIRPNNITKAFTGENVDWGIGSKTGEAGFDASWHAASGWFLWWYRNMTRFNSGQHKCSDIQKCRLMCRVNRQVVTTNKWKMQKNRAISFHYSRSRIWQNHTSSYFNHQSRSLCTLPGELISAWQIGELNKSHAKNPPR